MNIGVNRRIVSFQVRRLLRMLRTRISKCRSNSAFQKVEPVNVTYQATLGKSMLMTWCTLKGNQWELIKSPVVTWVSSCQLGDLIRRVRPVGGEIERQQSQIPTPPPICPGRGEVGLHVDRCIITLWLECR